MKMSLEKGINKETRLMKRREMKVSVVFVISCLITTVVVFANCQKGTIEPVAIEANDMCSFCRMSISEKRYAAELIDSDGHVFKFDDIGCLANFMKQDKTSSPFSATFVMDFERREWLEAKNAFYVRSSEFKTPMNGGIVAFRDQPSAQASLTKYHGTLISFAEVTK